MEEKLKIITKSLALQHRRTDHVTSSKDIGLLIAPAKRKNSEELSPVD